jgi:hypothetical protein
MTMALARRGCGADAVVRLEVSADLIPPRLSIDPTEERREDNLRMTREWLSARHGAASAWTTWSFPVTSRCARPAK